MKKRMVVTTIFLCLTCCPVLGYAENQCQSMQDYIGLMQQLGAGLKDKKDFGDETGAFGDKLNDLINFLRQIDQQEENAPLSRSLNNLEKVWMNQSFDTTNRDELGRALLQAAGELEKVYLLRCKQ